MSKYVPLTTRFSASSELAATYVQSLPKNVAWFKSARFWVAGAGAGSRCRTPPLLLLLLLLLLRGCRVPDVTSTHAVNAYDSVTLNRTRPKTWAPSHHASPEIDTCYVEFWPVAGASSRSLNTKTAAAGSPSHVSIVNSITYTIVRAETVPKRVTNKNAKKRCDHPRS